MVVGMALAAVGVFALKKPYTYQGSLIDPPVPAADFALDASNGSIFRLAEQRGKLAAMMSLVIKKMCHRHPHVITARLGVDYDSVLKIAGQNFVG